MKLKVGSKIRAIVNLKYLVTKGNLYTIISLTNCTYTIEKGDNGILNLLGGLDSFHEHFTIVAPELNKNITIL
jgi:hypothetical protein